MRTRLILRAALWGLLTHMVAPAAKPAPPGPAPAGMVWIPGGEFAMGSDEAGEALSSVAGVTRDAQPIPVGKHKIEVRTAIAGPGKEGTATLLVDGKEVGRTGLKRTVPAAFTATETFDVGVDLGSPVSLNYFDRRPFEFNGKIKTVKVELK